MMFLDTPVSPELLPPDEDGKIAQKTEETVGPYELHDFFMYQMVRHGFSPEKVYFLACKAFEGVYQKAVIFKWAKSAFTTVFSASSLNATACPDGPKGRLSIFFRRGGDLGACPLMPAPRQWLKNPPRKWEPI
jgi:NH(3)-dependent NAD(+) synthetase (EC 6.3.1.5)